jgi:hypothetical protein
MLKTSRRAKEDAVTEQPNAKPEQEDRETTGEPGQPHHPHVVTDAEAAVDDALGSTDNPH